MPVCPGKSIQLHPGKGYLLSVTHSILPEFSVVAFWQSGHVCSCFTQLQGPRSAPTVTMVQVHPGALLSAARPKVYPPRTLPGQL